MYLAAASYTLEQAHRDLGRMGASSTVDEFSDSLRGFVAAVRAVPSWISQLGLHKAERNNVEMTEMERAQRLAFEDWFKISSVTVCQHALNLSERIVVSADNVLRGEIVIDTEIAENEFMEDEFAEKPTGIRQTTPAVRSKPSDFYLDFDEHRPALELCAHYLDQVTALYDRARNEATRLRLVTRDPM